MMNAFQVTAFANRLRAPIELTEQAWQSQWSHRVAEDWRASAAVDTGEYRDSIHVTADGAEASAEHATFVERGTAFMAPQPALVPAINKNLKASAADAGRRVIRHLT
jgi:hypothetical protein